MRREGALQRVPLPADQPAVIGCAVTPIQRSRLIDALRNRASLSFCATFTDLSKLLRHSADNIDVIVLPARDAAGQDASRVVREIGAGRPRTAVVAWCDAGSHHSVEIRTLAVAGAHQFLFAGLDDDGVALRSTSRVGSAARSG
jgi:hypothetical protein